VRQAEAVGGRLLGRGSEHRGHHLDLAIGGTAGGVAGRPARHALRRIAPTGRVWALTISHLDEGKAGVLYLVAEDTAQGS
jgi:hypothetical protein